MECASPWSPANTATPVVGVRMRCPGLFETRFGALGWPCGGVTTSLSRVCPCLDATATAVAYGNTRTSIKGAGATQDVPIYQNDIGPLSLVNTQNNVAYGHTNTITGAMQETPIYEDVTSPSPLVSTIDTQDNVAYGCKQHH